MSVLHSVQYHVPSGRRTSDDPIFSLLRRDCNAEQLFCGFDKRAVLAPDESAYALLRKTAEDSLKRWAGAGAKHVNFLVGGVSLSEHDAPSDLCRLRYDLGLRAETVVMPLHCEFSQFNQAVVIADALIKSNQAEHVLVAVAGDWSRRVDYNSCDSKGAAVGAADGAASALVSATADNGWEILGSVHRSSPAHHADMVLQRDSVRIAPTLRGYPHMRSEPFFSMRNTAGFEVVKQHLVKDCVERLLRHHSVPESEVSLFPHQASKVLLDAWQAQLPAVEILHTLPEYGNMTVANAPVNLACHQDKAREHGILLTLGLDTHVHAVLLKRVRA